MKRSIKIILANALCLATMISLFASAYAQATEPDEVAFSQLGRSEITLVGPYDSTSFSFGLPADWHLSSAGKLDLDLMVVFNAFSNDPNISNTAAPVGGILTVQLNKVIVGSFPLNQLGDLKKSMPIPIEAYQATRTDGRMELRFLFDSGLSCLINQQMTIVILPSSRFTFPHRSELPSTNLADFPKQIYQSSIFPDSALIVVPDQPSASELQAAFTVAAGLGNLADSRINMDLTTASQLSAAQRVDNHLIFIGKPGSMPLISALNLPLPAEKMGFNAPNGAADDGIIQLVNSPWSPARVVLAVSGNTDAGVLKAAQAVSTGVLRSNSAENLAVIQSVQTNPGVTGLPTDQTLADLGYQGDLVTKRGSTIVAYRFYIPPGTTIASDSYFELEYSHSALIDYARSGMLVSLNDQQVGSARFSEETANNTTNSYRIALPASAVVPGNNLIEVNTSLMPVTNCSVPNFQGLWARIWPESRFHIPLGELTANISSVIGLDAYPAPFVFDASLGSNAIVLPRNDLESWRSALQIAEHWGDRANGAISMLSVYFDDEISAEQKGAYNFLIIGRPSRMPLVNELNKVLPAPFPEGSDIATEGNMQVDFRIQPDLPVGYLELMPSPWNPVRLIVAVLGNSDQGVKWAVNTLLDPSLRLELKGNFAAINGTQIVTADTRAFISPAIITTALPAAAGEVPIEITPQANTAPPVAQRSVGLLSALIATVILALFIAISVLYYNWKKS